MRISVPLLTAVLLLVAPPFVTAGVIALDFEDGLLPSSHGWTPAGTAAGDSSVINGSVPGEGGSKVLRIATTSAGWSWDFALTGIGADEDWFFEADINKVSGGGANDIGIGVVTGGSTELVVTSAATNTFDRYRIELTRDPEGAATGTLRTLKNGSEVTSTTGTFDAPTQLRFLFSNSNSGQTAHFDNMRFESTAPVPEPGSLALALLLGGAVYGRRRSDRRA